MDSSTIITDYNTFCTNIVEGCILYNMDDNNHWGKYLLVSNISDIELDNQKTYSVLLIGLRKNNDSFYPSGFRINLTPDYAKNVPYLKLVGYCSFKLVPVIENVNVNKAMITIYGNTDLHRYTEKLHIRKPRKRKYDNSGSLIIRKTKNV